MEPPTKKMYQITLPTIMREQLEEIAHRSHCPMSVLIRQVLGNFIQHAVGNQPTCADGTTCLCPGQWQRIKPQHEKG